jgi:hypothetical protein
MIKEAENFLRSRFGAKRLDTWKHYFPIYIVNRECDR